MNTSNRITHSCVLESNSIRIGVLTLLLMLFSFDSYAQAATRRNENLAINNGYLKIYDEVKQKVKDKKISSLDLLGYSRSFKLYSDMSSIEDATNIKREFFKKTADYLKKLSDCKTIVEIYEENRKQDSPKYIEAKKAYEPTLKEFEKFFNEPPKVKGGK